jgi:hypothetical protein
LPYGIKVLDKWQNTVLILQGVNHTKENVIVGSEYTQILSESIEGHAFEKYSQKVFPYLRPMSSMTEKEKNEYDNIVYGITNIGSKYKYYDLVDWLNKKMFDYRGLIEKGLALESPESMYEI